MTESIPNSFQTPNIVVDQFMELLTCSEFRVLMYMTRHILGWTKKVANKQANISLSVFEYGFDVTGEDGKVTHYGGCGLKKPAIKKALKALEKHGIVRKVGKLSNDGQLWELAFLTSSKVKIADLKARLSGKKITNKKRTEIARSVNENIVGGIVRQTPLDNAGGDCATDPQGDCATDPNETHINTLKPNILTPPENGDVQTAPKTTKKRNELFDTIAAESFGLKDSEAVKADKTVGGRVGKIIGWLKKNSPGATAETLRHFYTWYDVECKGCSRPADSAKFATHFMRFKEGVKNGDIKPGQESKNTPDAYKEIDLAQFEAKPDKPLDILAGSANERKPAA